MNAVIYRPRSRTKMSKPPKMNNRSIFGDILGPITGIINGALNDFKGPISEIVQFVVKNVLSTLIKFINNAIEEIFPGLDGLESGLSIVANYIGNLIDVTASLITNAVQTAVTSMSNVSSFMEAEVTAYIKVVETVFSDTIKLARTAKENFSRLEMETANLIVTAPQTIADNISDVLYTIKYNIGQFVDDASSATLTLGNGLLNDIRSIIVALEQTFSNIATTSKTIIETLLSDCEIVIREIVENISRGTEESVKTLEAEVIFASNEVVDAVEELKQEVRQLENHGKSALSMVTRDARRCGRETVSFIESSTKEMTLGFVKTKNAAGDVISFADSVVHYINSLGGKIAIVTILGFVLLMYLCYRDIRKYNQSVVGKLR